jgi:purine-nucleoside/S-methyl-5'-thioadenosine phosphorylase / adenosine deaminase
VTTLLGAAAEWPAPAHVRARVSHRHGGVSTAAYASLNLAAHVGDAADRVRENRRRLAEAWDLPAEPVWLEQVHGTVVADLDDGPWTGPADAAVTSRAGVVCAIMTADCLPVLLTDRDGTRIAAAHAGWRGLAAGVLPAAVAALGRPAATVLAWLGPAISAPAYEVGAEVRAAFVAADSGAEVAFAPNARGRWQADLTALARLSLAACGVTAVYGGGECTFTSPERFFSHRREAPCGRMASMIWLDTH